MLPVLCMVIIIFVIESNPTDVIEVEVDKETDEEEPNLEGRGQETTTTTESTTSTQRSTPLHVDKCHLPYYPAVDPDLDNSWRFGTVKNLH